MANYFEFTRGRHVSSSHKGKGSSRCDKCLEFKSIAEMSVLRGKPSRICKKCKSDHESVMRKYHPVTKLRNYHGK